MHYITTSRVLTAVRAVIVGAGLLVTALTVQWLATMPPPPPDSDGFAHGMAGLFGGVIIIMSLGASAFGVALPAVIGQEDPLGFNRRQRLVLQVAGIVIGGGIVVGLGSGLVTPLQYGIILWLGLVILAVLLVCAVLVWRLAEAVVQRLSRTRGPGTS